MFPLYVLHELLLPWAVPLGSRFLKKCCRKHSQRPQCYFLDSMRLPHPRFGAARLQLVVGRKTSNLVKIFVLTAVENIVIWPVLFLVDFICKFYINVYIPFELGRRPSWIFIYSLCINTKSVYIELVYKIYWNGAEGAVFEKIMIFRVSWRPKPGFYIQFVYKRQFS